MPQRQILKTRLVELDDLAARAYADPAARGALAEALAAPAAPLDPEAGLGEAVNRILLLAATGAASLRPQLQAAPAATENAIAETGATETEAVGAGTGLGVGPAPRDEVQGAIANLRQLLVTAIDTLNRS